MASPSTDSWMYEDDVDRCDWSTDDEDVLESPCDCFPVDFDCVDCGVNTLDINEYYMVTDDLWLDAEMDVNGGMLCIGCLEDRLGMTLQPHHFTACPVNDGDDFYRSLRLRKRLGTGGCFAEDEEDEPVLDVRPLITSFLDLDDYGSGLVPGDLDHKLRDERERDEYLYCIRDRIDYARSKEETKRRSEEATRVPRDLTWVPGISYGAGADGSKQWLDDQLSQMRIVYAERKLEARRFWWAKKRALPKSFRSIHDDPQLLWLSRRAELMRIRFNVRRHLEALGRFEVTRYNVTLANAPAWDRKLRNAAGDRRAKQTLYGAEWLPREYVHPTGLITTNPKRRAA